MSACSELNDQRFRDWVAATWGIRVREVNPGASIQGSPERSLSRVVFEDDRGRSFLLEKFARDKWEVRNRVNRTLSHLTRAGLNRVLAPETAGTGQMLPFFGRDCFQITRFLDATVLQRPQWLSSAGIGEEMATFLVDMHGAGKGMRISFPAFSIKDYIYTLFRDMATHHPEVCRRYLPVLRFLEQGFMDAHDRLTPGFCHGDFHPLNVIWDNHRIRAVIDWEFTGVKPDCYDAANLVGCAGIEHPEGLAMPMVVAFLDRIRTAGIMNNSGWRWFPEYILALRFAWLSEWLRNQDHEMLETEAVFMEILIRHMDDLRDIWQTEK